MSETKPPSIGWVTSETYAVVKRIEKKLWPFDDENEPSWSEDDVQALPITNEPNLGLATTEELFRELIARFTVSAESLFHINTAVALAEMLGGLGAREKEYRTVDHG